MDPLVGPIERGIVIPPSGRGNGTLRATMEKLSVGDSFETEYTKEAARNMAKRINIKIETRKAFGGNIRVWRVS